MATLDDAAKIALSLPEVTEGESRGMRNWMVGKKMFVWERPFTKADIKRFGDEPVPDGPTFAVRTADEHEKEALLAAGIPGVFTIEHFNGYNAVMIQLRAVKKAALKELIIDAWLAMAPEKTADAYLAKKRR